MRILYRIYVLNNSTPSNPALKQFTDFASLTFCGRSFQINDPVQRELIPGCTYIRRFPKTRTPPVLSFLTPDLF